MRLGIGEYSQISFWLMESRDNLLPLETLHDPTRTRERHRLAGQGERDEGNQAQDERMSAIGSE
jgi:hypothetical protein